MSNKNKELLDYLNRWQKAEPFDLYKNFHKLTEEEKEGVFYFIRGREFKLSKKGMKVLTKVEENRPLKRINLWLGLTPFGTGKVSFIPILGLTFEEKGVQHTFYYEMKDVKAEKKANSTIPNTDGSSVVSVPFVDRVRNNWLDTGSEQIADTLTSQSTEGLKRVLVYEIEGAGLDFFIAERQYLNALYVYPGVDLNKNSVADISFIPVFGLKFSDLQARDTNILFRKHGFGISWRVGRENEDDELYLDYSRPCPPTCHPLPPPPPGTGGS